MASKKLEDNLCIPREKLMAARLQGDYRSKDLGEAINILAEAGFEVYAGPVRSIEVQLRYDANFYRGIKDIREFVKYYKKNNKIMPPKEEGWFCY